MARAKSLRPFYFATIATLACVSAVSAQGVLVQDSALAQPQERIWTAYDSYRGYAIPHQMTRDACQNFLNAREHHDMHCVNTMTGEVINPEY